MKKTLRRLISVLLVFAAIITTVVMTVPAFAATPTSVGYQIYLSNLMLDNPTTQRIITGKYISPYRKLVEDRKDDPMWNASLQAWSVLTFNLSDLSSYTEKTIGYYEAILFDVLCESQKSENSLDNLNAVCKSTNSGVAKKIYDLYGNVLDSTLTDLQKDSDQYNKIMNSIEDMEELSEAFGLIGKISNVVQYCTDVNDLILKCSRLQSALNVYSEAGHILMSISNKTSDPSLKYACQKFKTLLDNSVNQADFMTIFIAEDTYFELADRILGDVWNSLVLELTGYGIAIKTGQALGKLASNILFSTDETIECYYSMLALYEFENCLRACVQDYEKSYKSNKCYGNAVMYNQSFMLLAKTEIEGSEYALKFLEIMNEKGLVNECYHNFSEKNMKWMLGITGVFLDFTQKNYKEIKQIIATITSEIHGIMYYITTDSYNDYVDYILDVIDVSTVPIAAEKEPMPITDELLEEYVKSLLETSDMFSNRKFTSSTTLTEDITVYGNVYMSADVDLDGHTLNIAGNLYHTDGVLEVNNGTLNVAGDYTIQKETVNNVGEVEYSPVDAALKMKITNDKVNIAGDFINRSCGDDYGYSVHSFSSGTMTVGGDIYDYGTDSYGPIKASGTHKLILNGTEKQTVYFNDSYSHFNILEATNTNIECTGYFIAMSLGSDVTFTSKGCKMCIVDLNGKTLTVNGDVEVIESINLNGGTMTVNGNMRHTSGTLTVNNGTLNVTGDYIAQEETVNNIGKVEYSSVSSVLDMISKYDKVNIGGSFITRYSGIYSRLSAGTLSIGGDIYYWDNYITAGETHKTVLNGEGKQTIYFKTDWSCFNILEATNTNIECTGYFRANSLGSDVTLTSNGCKMYVSDLKGKTLTVNGDVEVFGSIDLNGGTMTVNGNMRHTYGTLKVNNGTMNVTGDYIAQKETVNNIGEVEYSYVYAGLRMNSTNDKVNIAGDFINRSLSWNSGDGHSFSSGTMTVGGDIYDYGTNDYGRIEASGTHKTILNGESNQTVNFDRSGGHFNILVLTRPKSTYTFTPAKCWVTLIAIPEQPTVSAEEGYEEVTLTWNQSESAETYKVYIFENDSPAEVAEITDTTYTISDLEGGKEYTFLVTACNELGESEYTEADYITATPKIAIPAQPTVTAEAGYEAVTLTWDAVPKAYSYKVYTVENGKLVETAEVTATSYTISNLTGETEYTFLVRACNTSGESEYTEADYVKATPKIAIPAQPAVTATAEVEAVTLTWNAIPKASSYKVYTVENGKLVETAEVTATSCTISNLMGGTEYTFLVRACNESGESEYTEADFVKATPKEKVVVPSKPTNVKATAGDKQVTLSWSAATGATSYTIYKYENGKYTKITSTTSTTYTVTGLTNGTTYKFLVRAFNSAGGNTFTTADLVSATPKAPVVTVPSKPTNVKATAGDKQVTLSWAAADGATSYTIYKYANGTYTKITSTTKTTYTVTGLTNGTTYKFLVRAFNSAGGNSFTTADLVSATPKAAATTVPTKPTVTANVQDKVVTFSWNAVSGATYYKLYNYSGGKYGLIATVTDTTYRLRYLKNGTTYQVLVRAFNEKGGSAFTTADLISVTPKAATAVPDKPVVTATVSGGNVSLKWAHVPTAFSYTIYKYENGTYTKLGATCDNYFTVKGLTTGKTYSILVRAFNSKGGHKVTSSDRVSVTL